VVEIVAQIVNGLYLCCVTLCVMLEHGFTENAPDQFVQMSRSEDELEQVEAVEEYLEQRLSKVNLT